VRRTRLAAILLVAPLAVTACGGSASTTSAAASKAANSGKTTPGATGTLPNSPAPTVDIYSHDRQLSPAVAGQKSLIYVPNHGDGTVTVIDPSTYRVIDTYKTGGGPQHIVPSWDLQTLYATNDEGGNSLTPIDPRTGKRGGPNIPVADPYNMYFTPDGSSAIVVAEAQQRLDFRDPHTFKLQYSIPVQCPGVDHIDFSADLKTFVATCEFSGQLVKVDLASRKVVGYLKVPGQPQDIKLDSAGKVYYVAGEYAGGVDLVNADTFTLIGFLPTGPEAHGLYVSRDSRFMYVSNRGGTKADPTGTNGSVSVIDLATRKVVANWPIPDGTPDMGNVSVDGKVLWLSGRRSNEVYAIDTTTGHLIKRIPVGREPHGMAVWPQPGRFSLGHTGIMR
jgi:YVTN family beta-propeller protein